MADATIGALRVLLGVDTAAFTSGFEGATSQLEKFSKGLTSSLGTAAVAAGAALAGVVGGIGIAVQRSIEQMDQLGKLSEKIGVPVEKLSALKVAAELSDVSIEAVGRSMSKLSTNMLAVAGGAVTPAASAFHALGISLTTLKSNDPSVVLAAIAEKFSGFQDGATKSALASAIFGQRIGKEMIPLLNLGSEGLQKARQDAEDFGAVISTKTSNQAREFVDNLKLFGVISQGISNVLATNLLPPLIDITNAMIGWARQNDVVATSANYLLRVVALLADNFTFLLKVIEVFVEYRLATLFLGIAIQVYEFGKALYAAAVAGEVLNAIKAITIARFAAFAAIVLYATGNLDAFIEKVKEVGNAIGGMLPDIGGGMAKAAEAIGINLNALTGNLEGLKGASNTASEALKNLKPPPAFNPASAGDAKKFNEEILKLGMQARELRGDFEGLAPGFTAAAVKLKLIKDTGEGFVGTVDTLTPKMKQLNDALLGVFGAQLIKDALTPWQQFEVQINRIQAALDAGKISTDTFANATMKAASKMMESYGQAAATAAGNFADFFNTFAHGNATMFAIGKAFSISQAIINTLVGATKALAELGPVLGPIAAGAMVAAGMAQVAKIVAQQPAATMARGGTFQVSGAGGVDTQMVPIMATPGERVSVDQNKYGDSGSGKTVTVQGISPKDYYRGDVLRDIMANINQAIGDGYKIKVA